MVPAMVRWLAAAALFTVILTTQGCGGRSDADPAGTVQAVLAAVHARDAAAFEAHLDRAALRQDLRGQLMRVARANGVEVDGGPSEFALDRMIGLNALHLVQAGTDRPLASAPSKAEVAGVIRNLDPGHVCLHDLSPQRSCLLTFAKAAAGWRLVGMRADDLKIEIAPAAAKP